MAQITVPWLQNKDTALDCYADALGELGIEVAFLPSAVPALNEFTTKQHPIIIMDVYVGPGTASGGAYGKDPQIAEIMAQSKVKFHELGLYVLTETRRQGPNMRTPIIVASNIFPDLDELFPHAERTCRESGATAYVDLNRVLPSQFNDIVRQYLPKQQAARRI